MLYSYAIQATREGITTSLPGVCDAVSEAEATGYALQMAYEKAPSVAGWSDHRVAVMEIPDYLLRRIRRTDVE